VALVLSSPAPAFAEESLDETLVNTPIADKWAVIVGISQFQKSALNLQYAAKDATDFRNFLINKCHFAPDHVKLLTNSQATKNRILDVMGDSWLPRVTLPDDLVVIFFSSHGSPSDMDVAGVNYIVAHDTNPEKLFTTGIDIQELAATIKKRVHASRVLVIFDACHSGGASDASKGIRRQANVDASLLAQGTGCMVICSSQKNEASWESKKYPNGVFTHTLIDAFQSKGSATKLTDAFAFLKTGVQQEVVAERGLVQTPVLEMSKWKGRDLVLAAKPASPRKPLVADEPEVVPQQTAMTIPVGSTPRIQASTVQSSPPAQSTLVQSTPVQSTSMQSSPVQSTAMMTPVQTPQLQQQPAYGAPQTQSPAARIPSIAGHWVGTNGCDYHFTQQGREFAWSMPPHVEGRGTISEDGKTATTKWWGAVNGTSSSNIETDINGKVVRLIASDGHIFMRAENKHILPWVPCPDLIGLWHDSTRGVQFMIWQIGSVFGWSVPIFNEVGSGSINVKGNEVTVNWTGLYGGQFTGPLVMRNGRAVQMVGSNGRTINRR
jgi:hypothetical protein